MNYIGSKHRLSEFINDVICSTVEEDLSQLVFCDLFAGTGIVGRYFKPKVKEVISNDVEFYSYVLNRHYILNNSPDLDSAPFIEHLNKLPLTDGFIFQNYAEGGRAKRQYFSSENGQRIDAMRQQIECWKNDDEISDDVYYYLLVSLLESADKVANTASVYGAYLKSIKPTAQRELLVKPAVLSFNQGHNKVFNEDSNQLIEKIEGDILYLDPPYNARQYGANYHLLNTIARYDEFEPKGKTGLREYYKSDYCSKVKVEKAFEDLIAKANFKYIFLSYNNEGIMSVERVEEIMKRYGQYSLQRKAYQRFKADKDHSRHHKAKRTEEFLHVLIKA